MPNEIHGLTGTHSKAISSITKHHLFFLQNYRLILILIRVMGGYLVTVLILMRVICRMRVMLFSFGTREYYMQNVLFAA